MCRVKIHVYPILLGPCWPLHFTVHINNFQQPQPFHHSTRLKILNTFLRLNKIRQVQGGFKCDAQLFFKRVSMQGIEIYFWVEDIFQFDQLVKKTATPEPMETFLGLKHKKFFLRNVFWDTL